MISILLIFFIGKILSGDLTGLVSSALYAIDPIPLVFNQFLISDTLFTFLFLAGLFGCIQYIHSKSVFANFRMKQEELKLGESNELIEMKSSLIVNGKVLTQNTGYEGNKRMGTYFSNELLNSPILISLTNKIINLSNELNPFNGITYNGVPKYSFNKYEIGDFLDWHSDVHETMAGATITFIIQLNDDYDNGSVKYLINEVEYSVNKKQGSVFIFDSNITHSVDTITNGLRYSLNVWPSKEIKKSLI
jgi:ectoine hydroxylase-related dioxygenase (phytanoyl-CoA dioxygenase family)